ncbi:MAG TPA: hypothetical protein DDZ88_29880 [Verrucomicrobiales bacterium]|nr:hypothetical protein [Verrucomicrobiales bacterium]
MLTSKDISDAKKRLNKPEGHHEHDDCIRIAYEWLDAQTITKSIGSRQYALKHMIERWAGRYVSQSDVEVAAELHPCIRGKYPFFNISSRLTEPSTTRLEAIGQAMTHHNRESHQTKDYSRHEDTAR